MSENYNANEADPVGANASHIFRYFMARGYIEKGDKVLDAACGFGYGSRILQRSQAERIMGIDYREDCINYAAQKYDGITFLKSNLNTIEDLPEFDLSVCIETIEHLEDPIIFARLLKDKTKRTIFISTPIIPTVENNKDHKHDFTPASLIALFEDKEWRGLHWCNQGNVYGQFVFVNVKEWAKRLS